MTTRQLPDLLAEVRGQIQAEQRMRQASEARETQMSHRASRSAQDAFDAQESHRRAQEQVRALRGTLRGVRESLEKMHVPGCLRAGYACPACDALDDLDA